MHTTTTTEATTEATTRATRTGARRSVIALALLLATAGVPSATSGQTSSAATPEPAAHTIALRAAADTVEVLYRRARALLNEGRFMEAADHFARLRAEYEASRYVPESYYFEALARYRTERRAEMERATRLLQRQLAGYPEVVTARESELLLARIRAELARRGSASAARSMEQEMAQLERQLAQSARQAQQQAEVEDRVRAEQLAQVAQATRETEARTAQALEAQEACEAEWEVRAVALEALYGMDPDRGNDMLRDILANRDRCARTVREMALWLLAERAGQGDGEARDLLIELALEDAGQDAEIREVALMVLAESGDEAAFDALMRIAERGGAGVAGEELWYALAMTGRPEAAEVLERRLVAGDVEDEEALVYALAETGGIDVLRRVYPRLGPDARAAVVWAVAAEGEDDEALGWLRERLADPGEDAEVRAAAMYRLADEGVLPMASVLEVYRTAEDPDLREQALWIVAGMEPDGDLAARIDALIGIVRTEEDPELRQVALHALTEIEDPRVAEFLAEFLRGGGGG